MQDDDLDMDSYRSTPLFLKAEEILDLTYTLIRALPEEAPNARIGEDDDEDDPARMHDPIYAMRYTGEHATEVWKNYQQWIMECASIIPTKIAGATGADIYDMYYEQAALIRKACRELVTNLRALQMCGYDEQQYFDLIRDAVQDFKPLFREWVGTFSEKEYIPDSWGLFNPPGVEWDDDI